MTPQNRDVNGQPAGPEATSAFGGVRSLGAALLDGTLFVGKKIAPNIGPLLVPGCKGLQPSKPITTIEP
jgi:hypothetical protein